MSVYDLDADEGAPLVSERMANVVALLAGELVKSPSTADAAASVAEAVGLSLSEVGFLVALASKEVK